MVQWRAGQLICNSLDSTLRTALASFYVSDTDWHSIEGILSVMIP
jgi:hypothetical protein